MPSPRLQKKTSGNRLINSPTAKHPRLLPWAVKNASLRHTFSSMLLYSEIGSQQLSVIRLTPNALRVLEKRYLGKDRGFIVETPEEMFRRVAHAVAQAELIYDKNTDTATIEDEFFSVMSRLEFLPNSPTLLNAGREMGQLSACFAVPVEDSVEGIFDAVKYTALIHKSGGGTGFSFSRIRPQNDPVKTADGVAGGPVSFMPAFSMASDIIKQGGIRRGCSIGLLSVHHPDILKFIVAKNDPNALTNFCISVAATDEFMKSVRDGTEFNLIHPASGEVVGRLDARDVFDRIVTQSWKTGDPGFVFIDRINRDNATPQLGMIENVSGCAEQVLLPFESCNLGSINLGKIVQVEAEGHNSVDYVNLARITRLAVNLLDNVIDINKYPIPQIEEMTKKTRKIGLSVMGLADMLILLGVPYDSQEGLDIAARVMRFITHEAHEASQLLAEKRGVFPAWHGSVYDGKVKMRNSSLTTIAPTGTISLIAGCCNGIEPYFALVFVRNILDGEQLLEVNPYFESTARAKGFYIESVLKQLVTGKSIEDIQVIPEDVKRLYVTTNRISPQWHVRMEAAFQREVDGAVSKMINVPNETTKAEQARLFLMGYDEGLKGITIYRNGSRELESLCTDERGSELVSEYFLTNA